MVTSDQLPNNNSARKQNILKVLYISTSFPTISKSPSAHRLSLSLRSAVVVQCSLSLGRLSSPRLRYGRYVQFGGNVETRWPSGSLEGQGGAVFPAGHVVVVSHCRFTPESQGHGPPPFCYRLTVPYRNQPERAQAQPTTHNPQPTRQRNRMWGWSCCQILIHQSIN